MRNRSRSSSYKIRSVILDFKIENRFEEVGSHGPLSNSGGPKTFFQLSFTVCLLQSYDGFQVHITVRSVGWISVSSEEAQ